MLESVIDWEENIDRNRENVYKNHFFLFPRCSLMASFSWSLKVGIELSHLSSIIRMSKKTDSVDQRSSRTFCAV